MVVDGARALLPQSLDPQVMTAVVDPVGPPFGPRGRLQIAAASAATLIATLGWAHDPLDPRRSPAS